MKTLAATIVLFVTFGSLLAVFQDEGNFMFSEALQTQMRLRRNAPTSRAGNVCNGTEKDCCASYYGPKCFGCNTLLTCAGELLNKQSCSSIDPNKPYCNDTSCTATPPNDACLTSNNFRCTGPGFFPNSDDCSKYYYCTGTTANSSYSFDCPTNQAYQSALGTCKTKTSAADCKTVSCVGNSNKYQVWASDKSILVYCLDTLQTKETVLFRCNDPQNREYDPLTLQCKFVCKAEGRFGDIDSCTRYYECAKNGTVLQATLRSCPPSFKFDRSLQMCVFGTC